MLAQALEDADAFTHYSRVCKKFGVADPDLQMCAHTGLNDATALGESKPLTIHLR